MTVAAAALIAACGPTPETVPAPSPFAQPGVPRTIEPNPGETRLANIRMLTNGGENAEAYFSADGSRLTFQATRPGVSNCDQIYTMNADGTDIRMVSTGEGATTCAFFFPDGERILYSSTHEHSPECPPRPDYSQGYVWPLHPFDIYTARADGSDLRKIGSTEHYDAEATISPDGSRIVFTSTRDGDLEIYTMNADGTDIRRLTNEPGYDGGAFFTPDGNRIVYRARHPESPEELADYQRLLGENLIRPSRLDIYLMDLDGSNRVRVTNNGAANFAPYMHPDGQRIIFSSNMDDPEGRNFELYMINIDGTGLERITHSADFDGFPMFTADGSRLVFASNRHHAEDGETNVFIADWVE